MAAATARRGLLRCGYHYGASLARTSHLNVAQCSSLLVKCSIPGRSDQVRRIFQTTSNADWKRTVFVDTSALSRKLEAQGIPSDQIETITSAAMVVLSDSLENLREMQKEHHFYALQREIERLKKDIEKLQTDLKYEIFKVTGGIRLDLDLNRGCTRDELNNRSIETNELNKKLDREIHALRMQLGVSKDNIIKYCIGALLSFTPVFFAVIRILH